MATKKIATSVVLFTMIIILVLLTFAHADDDHHGKNCPTPTPNHKHKHHPSPKSPVTTHHHHATCPRDALKLGVCLKLLGGLVGLTLGSPPKTPCCSLIGGLADLEAAACLCTILKANVLGLINLNVPVSLSLLLNVCTKKVPPGFQCA